MLLLLICSALSCAQLVIFFSLFVSRLPEKQPNLVPIQPSMHFVWGFAN